MVVWEGGNCGWLCGKVVIVGGCVGRWLVVKPNQIKSFTNCPTL